MTTNKWNLINSFDEYYDFEKELFSVPDQRATSIDITLTFNVETKTCYYCLSLRHDDGNSIDWEKPNYVTWDVGLSMLGDEMQVPVELLFCAHE